MCRCFGIVCLKYMWQNTIQCESTKNYQLMDKVLLDLSHYQVDIVRHDNKSYSSLLVKYIKTYKKNHI